MSIQFCGWEACLDGRKHLKPGQQPERGHGYTMYHGTHKDSARTIITSGFRPSAGGTLGQGVYCSRAIQKAMGYPGNCSPNDRVVLLLKVRVGKVKKIDAQNWNLATTWHQSGYDTAWIPPAGGLEEDCVWDPSRLTVVGIAHCTDPVTKSDLEKLIKQHSKIQARADKGTQGNCKVCGKDGGASHSVSKCWGCAKRICPFMVKHVCKKQDRESVP
ncbi:uncharacterized protein LOC121304084 [Polyodon spathula]|uniref:uncharacterized protein LOC121304084 n=1 Tax=Polyodon spathula TaxID=7913 RepID=UPI001B7EB0F1|nr:uncharacterized protein LOC121304084 [Polyodon spathula]